MAKSKKSDAKLQREQEVLSAETKAIEEHIDFLKNDGHYINEFKKLYEEIMMNQALFSTQVLFTDPWEKELGKDKFEELKKTEVWKLAKDA